MWKRERSEPVDLEHVLTEPPAPVALATRPASPPPAPVVEVPAERTPAPAATSSHAPAAKGSTLGATLRFKGDLVADEDLVIQGQVEGSILHTRSLTIGAQGRVLGDIRARRIIVEGSVDGNLYALESVTLRSGAVVRGDVFAAGIAIDDGARLTGRIDMDNAPTVPTIKVPVPDSTEPAARDLSAPEADALLTGS
jgi:cytoskeletal protein CcmA (bactofilin family)